MPACTWLPSGKSMREVNSSTPVTTTTPLLVATLVPELVSCVTTVPSLSSGRQNAVAVKVCGSLTTTKCVSAGAAKAVEAGTSSVPEANPSETRHMVRLRREVRNTAPSTPCRQSGPVADLSEYKTPYAGPSGP